MIDHGPLAAVAQALRLPTFRPPGCVGLCVAYCGSLHAFAEALGRAGIAHRERATEDGPAVEVAGLVVEPGGMGGVLVRELADWDERPGGDPGAAHVG